MISTNQLCNSLLILFFSISHLYNSSLIITAKQLCNSSLINLLCVLCNSLSVVFISVISSRNWWLKVKSVLNQLLTASDNWYIAVSLRDLSLQLWSLQNWQSFFQMLGPKSSCKVVQMRMPLRETKQKQKFLYLEMKIDWKKITHFVSPSFLSPLSFSHSFLYYFLLLFSNIFYICT